MSEEKKQFTAEGIPEEPPHDPACTTLTSQTIRVSWTSPSPTTANGIIKGYKVIYGPTDTWYGRYRFYSVYLFTIFCVFIFNAQKLIHCFLC